MAHFAELNQDKIVTRVLVTSNALLNEGYDWLIETFGGTWIQTSYNANIRCNYAGVGFSYDSELDAFIAPQPYPSWELDENCHWQAPSPYPQGNKIYKWNEENLNWQLVNNV